MYHGVTPSEPKPTERDASAEDEAPEAATSEKDVTKKERVLHTRVPAVLERELKRFADNLRVPVSNLVRTILEDAVQAADVATETVEQRLRRAAGTLEHERERIKKKIAPDPLHGVYAFQAVTLAKAQSCAKCDSALAVGEAAHLGLSDSPSASRVFVCDACLPQPE